MIYFRTYDSFCPMSCRILNGKEKEEKLCSERQKSSLRMNEEMPDKP